MPRPDHLEGHSFVSLLADPDRQWKRAVFSESPNPALREWAANPLSQPMRETWFGRLVRKVESRSIDQQGDAWDRELFERHLVGKAMRTDRYRLVLWLDRRDPVAEPLFVELYDHRTDPGETTNVALERPETVARLRAVFRAGWNAAL